jgi:hypothetical protein
MYKPSDAMVALAGATETRLAALRQLVAPRAKRHPDDLVPSDILRRARRLLADARRALSREADALLHPLRAAAVWSDLAAAIELALTSLAAFNARNKPPSPAMQIILRKIADRIEQLNQG